ncbi:MAG: hypothetical protein IT427_21080 [Pirellulales bacterium]|nr:hypothetical protein [Pirellulales bacterium]
MTKLDASATVERTIGYAYDQGGRLHTVTDRDGSDAPVGADYTYYYDNLNRVAQDIQTLAGLSPIVSFIFGYDDLGRRSEQSTQLDSTFDFYNQYSYDALSRPTLLKQSGIGGIGNAVAAKRVDFTYNADGQFDAIKRYATTGTSQLVAQSTYGYDGVGRIDGLLHERNDGSGLSTVAGYAWTWDPADRPMSFSNTEHSGEDADYTYDASGQLVGADYDSLTDESYSYDDNGNRIDVENSGGSVTYTTDDNNLLEDDGTFTYKYDGEGNLIQRTEKTGGDYSIFE